MSTCTKLIVSAVVAALGVTSFASPARSSPSSQAPRETSLASFQGRTIDLSKSWEGAQACAVLSRTEVPCYASRKEEKADLASRARSVSASPGTGSPIGTLDWNECDDGWLCIYEHADFNGRKLSFNDEYWHVLDRWGFKDQTSSFTNNQGGGWFGCSGTDEGYLEDDARNYYLMHDCTAAAKMGSYNDKARNIKG